MAERRAAALLSALALAAAAVSGQTSSQQSVEESIQVDFVRVVVGVTDAHGAPVPGIRPSEVHVLVDGRTVPVATFETLVPDPTAGSDPDAPPAPPAAPAPKATPAGAPPNAPFRLVSALGILVDETTSQQFHRNAVYGQILKFLDGGLPSGTLVALARFDGTLRWECPWTADVARLRRAAENMRDHAFAARIGAPGDLGPAGPGVAPAIAAQDAESILESSSAALVAALQEFPDETADRKTLVFVTDGGPFLTQTEVATELVASARSAAEMLPPAFRGAVLEHEAARDSELVVESAATKRRWFSQMTDAADVAIRRGIEIVPVRSGSVDASALASADSGNSIYDPDGSLATSGALVRRRGTDPSAARLWAGVGMQQMADETGGDVVLSRGDLARKLRRELDERDVGYVLTFRDPHGADNLFHAISVEIDRPGLNLRYRRGYRTLAGGERLVDALVGRLYRARLENPLQATAEARVASRGARAVEVGVTVSYPSPAGPGRAAARRVEIVGVCESRTGRRSEPFRLAATVPVTAAADGSLRAVVPFRVRLVAGRTRIHIALRDQAAGATSFLRLEKEF